MYLSQYYIEDRGEGVRGGPKNMMACSKQKPFQSRGTRLISHHDLSEPQPFQKKNLNRENCSLDVHVFLGIFSGFHCGFGSQEELCSC